MMSGTLKGTLYSTATTGLGINSGTGSTIEITSRETERALLITGYKEAITALNVPLGALSAGDMADRGNGYVTARFGGDNFITRFELNDMLHGLGWKLIGYSSAYVGTDMVCNEVWSKHIKNSKKH